MTVADIIAEFGAYYLNHGQNKKDLVKLLNYTSETDQLFTRRNTNDTVIRISQSLFTRVLQSFQKSWTPLGAVEFKPKEIPLFNFKIDFEEYPDELKDTWLGFLASEENDRRKWPFVKWLIEQHIIPQSQEDYELDEVYDGVYAAPATGVPSAAGTTMNGIKKQLNDGISAGTIATIATGAPVADPVLFYEQIEDFVKQIDKRYWRHNMALAMDQDLHQRFRQGKREKFNMHYAQEKDLDSVVDFNARVVGLPSMAGSTKIWCTPKENAICGVKWARKENAFEIEKVDRKVKLYTDWYKGLGWVIDQLVFTNDQELPVA